MGKGFQHMAHNPEAIMEKELLMDLIRYTFTISNSKRY